MNLPTFFSSKVEEGPQGFIHEVFKVRDDMCVTSLEKAELAAYQVKDMAQVLYEQWKKERLVRGGWITWGNSRLLSLIGFPLKIKGEENARI